MKRTYTQKTLPFIEPDLATYPFPPPRRPRCYRRASAPPRPLSEAPAPPTSAAPQPRRPRPPAPRSGNKESITIRLDSDILEFFRHKASLLGRGHYQTLINRALREYMAAVSIPREDLLNRIARAVLPYIDALRHRPPPSNKEP